MERTKTLRRLLAVTLTAAFTMVTFAPPSGALANKEVHCIVEIVSVDDTGLGTLGPLECSSSQASARAAAEEDGVVSLLSYTIATHYSLFNYYGSSLTVTGTGCNGVYINMPQAWVDVVSSTRSTCTVIHYDYFYMFGSTMTLFNPGGNLVGFDNMTNSAKYL